LRFLVFIGGRLLQRRMQLFLWMFAGVLPLTRARLAGLLDDRRQEGLQ
jgi:hypothetical protein